MGTDLSDIGKWPALSYEIDGTWYLLQHADELLRDLRGVYRIEPLLACLAIGAEKLLKLVHGLTSTQDTGQWPSRQVMRNEIKHAVDELDRTCREHIRNHLHQCAAPPYIAGLLADVDADELLAALLSTLSNYARAGRFHNLDTLADSPPPAPPPRVLWEALEHGLLEDRPDLVAGLGTVEGYESARAAMNEALRQSLIRWWELYWRSALHGAFGPAAKQWFSSQNDPRRLG